MQDLNFYYFFFLSLLPDLITLFLKLHAYLFNLINQHPTDLKEMNSALRHLDASNQAAILDCNFPSDDM